MRISDWSSDVCSSDLLDDLKDAWQSLDHRLDQQHTLQLHIFRERKLDALRRHLRPLVWGHALQMVSGVSLVLLAASVWNENLHQTHLLVAGLAKIGRAHV